MRLSGLHFPGIEFALDTFDPGLIGDSGPRLD